MFKAPNRQNKKNNKTVAIGWEKSLLLVIFLFAVGDNLYTFNYYGTQPKDRTYGCCLLSFFLVCLIWAKRWMKPADAEAANVKSEACRTVVSKCRVRPRNTPKFQFTNEPNSSHQVPKSASADVKTEKTHHDNRATSLKFSH